MFVYQEYLWNTRRVASTDRVVFCVTVVLEQVSHKEKYHEL